MNIAKFYRIFELVPTPHLHETFSSKKAKGKVIDGVGRSGLQFHIYHGSI